MSVLQVLLGDLNLEQFSQIIGVIVGYTIGFIFILSLLSALFHGILDGWLFRKGALYYGSLRYLNKLFKELRNCDNVRELYSLHSVLIHVINLLYFQRALPSGIIKRLVLKLDCIFQNRLNELPNYWGD